MLLLLSYALTVYIVQATPTPHRLSATNSAGVPINSQLSSDETDGKLELQVLYKYYVQLHSNLSQIDYMTLK